MLISKIIVPEGRHLRGSVVGLAESISIVGLLNPITVLPDCRLVAGLHRLEACRSLGWTEIDATITKLDEAHARLAELDENLCQNQYTVLERGEALSLRKSYYLALHPETKRGTAGGRASGESRSLKPGKKAGTSDGASLANRPEHVSAFVADTARKTGRHRRSIERDIQVAAALPTETRDVLRGTALEDSQEKLLLLGKLPADELHTLTEQGADALIHRLDEVPKRKHGRKEEQPSESKPPVTPPPTPSKSPTSKQDEVAARESAVATGHAAGRSASEIAGDLGIDVHLVRAAKSRLGLVRRDSNPLSLLEQRAVQTDDAWQSAIGMAEQLIASASDEARARFYEQLSHLISTTRRLMKVVKAEVETDTRAES